ncbi:MAG: glycerol-3-phosphate dehydrogenase [Devosia sp.]
MDEDAQYDVFVIGGGINGTGIARDLVGRGYRVALAEKNDFASGTSSWSTKLIHGGLRYLEHYEFRLVREALLEREVLWAMAPHIIWPLRFVLPHHKGLRPRWFLRLGLFVYDHLGGRKRLPATRSLNLTTDPVGAPLRDDYKRGFEYSDCWVDDARLVVLNARDAADKGADIMARTAVVAARPTPNLWHIDLRSADGTTQTVTAKMVVNAAGPWVDKVLGQALGRNDAHNVRLVQGSHIVIAKKFDHPKAYIFQNTDKRIIFAIPYEDDFTLVGTTDRDYEGDPKDAAITPEEVAYLCKNASAYFKAPVTPDDIVWTYSGVRPLYDDGASSAQEATRDYVLKAEAAGERAPIINIFGGKLTTYRKLAEATVEKVGELIGQKGKPWTGTSVLPGGDMSLSEAPKLADQLTRDYPFLPATLARRYARLYGTKARILLGEATSMDDLGETFGAHLTAAEVRYLAAHEWARTADDVLWRRTKLGLRLSKDEAAALDRFMGDGRAVEAAAE